MSQQALLGPLKSSGQAPAAAGADLYGATDAAASAGSSVQRLTTKTRSGVLDRAAKAPPLVSIDPSLPPRTNYVKSKIEPRVFWAAERTLLKYVLVSLVIIAVGMGNLFAANDLAKYSSYVFLTAALCFVVYAPWVYHRRVFHAAALDPSVPRPTRYDDRIGPFLICFLITVAVLLLLLASVRGRDVHTFTCPVVEPPAGCALPESTTGSPITVEEDTVDSTPFTDTTLRQRVATCTAGPFSGSALPEPLPQMSETPKSAARANTTWSADVDRACATAAHGGCGLFAFEYVAVGTATTSRFLTLTMRSQAFFTGALPITLPNGAGKFLTTKTLASCRGSEEAVVFAVPVSAANAPSASRPLPQSIDAEALNTLFKDALRLNATAPDIFQPGAAVLSLTPTTKALQSVSQFPVPLGDAVGQLRVTATFSDEESRAVGSAAALALAVDLPAGDTSFVARRRAQALLVALRAADHVTTLHEDFFNS